MMINVHAPPTALPDTNHPPAPRTRRLFPQQTVRLIPIDEAEPMLADQIAERLAPERGLRQAHERLAAARAAVGEAKAELARAEADSSTARDFAVRTRVAYERARADARRSELAVRQQQRRTEDATLAMRQAYELVAHLEGLNGSAIIDLTLEHGEHANS
jgi:hypothetical protein